MVTGHHLGAKLLFYLVGDPNSRGRLAAKAYRLVGELVPRVSRVRMPRSLHPRQPYILVH